MKREMISLVNQIRTCQHCSKRLPLPANPILSASSKSKIIIISQAPGIIAHNKSFPFQDKSGENLRSWLGVDEETFYNPDNFAIMPMSFCYPGKGKSGDLPPLPDCAPLWHEKLLLEMEEVQLKLLIGQYSQKYYLGKNRKKNLTETVRCFEEYLPIYFPLPHPSPRNNIWQAKNSWFGEEVLPVLKEKVGVLLG